MTFPSGVPDGYEYTNPDNNKVYRWDDPPGAWTFLGINDGGGGSGGETPNPPGEGLVLGTEPRVQLYPYDNNQLCSYVKDDFAVKVDKTLAPNLNGEPDLIFSYSYDLTTWYPCNETGGSKQGLMWSIGHGVKSNGDEVYFAKETGQYARIWKSNNGIDWSVQSVSGMNSTVSAWSTVAYSKDTMILLNQGTSSHGTIWRSTDDGATWSAKSLGFTPQKKSWFIDNDIMVAFAGGNDCRVSIDGGNTFQQCSGLPSGFNGVTNATIAMTKTDPKTLILISELTTLNSVFYLKLSDIENGNRSFTAFPTDSLNNGAIIGNNITTEINGNTYNVMYVFNADAVRVRAIKLNSDNTDIEDQRQYFMRGLNISGISACPSFPNIPQEGKTQILSPNGVSFSNNLSSAVAGFGPDLFFNGIKVEFSSRNRLSF